jgi:hypothetical protein
MRDRTVFFLVLLFAYKEVGCVRLKYFILKCDLNGNNSEVQLLLNVLLLNVHSNDNPSLAEFKVSFLHVLRTEQLTT